MMNLRKIEKWKHYNVLLSTTSSTLVLESPSLVVGTQSDVLGRSFFSTRLETHDWASWNEMLKTGWASKSSFDRTDVPKVSSCVFCSPSRYTKHVMIQLSFEMKSKFYAWTLTYLNSNCGLVWPSNGFQSNAGAKTSKTFLWLRQYKDQEIKSQIKSNR